MEINFNSLSKENNQEVYINSFKKIFLKNFFDKNILVVNAHEKIILCMLENCFRNNSGLSILQYNPQESSLDQIIQKNKFKYLLLPKSYFLNISINYSKVLSFNVFETEYEFIEIKNNQEFTEFSKSIVLFTSGSSGERKPVIISHKSMIACANFMSKKMKIVKSDLEIIYAQLDHAFALGRIISCALCDASFLFFNSKKLLKPSTIERFMDLEGLSGISCMPSVLYGILSNNSYSDYFSKKLKYVQIGAMFLPSNKKIEIVKKLPNTKIFAHYGMTEYMRATFYEISSNLNKSNSEGKPSSGTIIKIDKIANELEKEEDFQNNNKDKNLIGEILLKGPHLADGYIDKNEWNKKLTDDGFFKTGDIGYLDENGYLIHKGRKDNIFNFQGKLFSSTSLQEKIEKKFKRLEGKIAIIPHRAKNSIRDTEIMVFVSNNEGIDQDIISEKDIKKFFLEFGLRITIFQLDSDLPLSANGKIAYGKLRQYLKEK